jgi:LPS export ABC transporter protein LptC
MSAPNRLRQVATALLSVCALGSLGADASQGRISSTLRVTGMTFVGSRGSVNELVLHAQRGELRPETNIASLEDVQVSGKDSESERSFDVRCKHGELDVDKNDFLAEGDVHGTTGEGQRYRTAWVRYDHAKSLLYTDAPVAMEDATGSYRGDGFRYDVSKGSFRLLGNVSVVQKP